MFQIEEKIDQIFLITNIFMNIKIWSLKKPEFFQIIMLVKVSKSKFELPLLSWTLKS